MKKDKINYIEKGFPHDREYIRAINGGHMVSDIMLKKIEQSCVRHNTIRDNESTQHHIYTESVNIRRVLLSPKKYFPILTTNELLLVEKCMPGYFSHLEKEISKLVPISTLLFLFADLSLIFFGADREVLMMLGICIAMLGASIGLYVPKLIEWWHKKCRKMQRSYGKSIIIRSSVN